MTGAAADPPKKQAPRWMWILLIVSLAINLLVAGGAVGAFWHLRHERGLGFGGPSHGFSRFLDGLPAEKRQKIEALLDKQRAEMVPLRAAARTARHALLEAFKAEPFDKEKFRQLGKTYRAARRRLSDVRLNDYPDILALLEPAERKAFLRWQKWRRHGHRRHETSGEPKKAQ